MYTKKNAHTLVCTPLNRRAAGCLEWMPVSEAQDGTSDMPGFVPDGFWSVVLKDLKVGSDSMIR